MVFDRPSFERHRLEMGEAQAVDPDMQELALAFTTAADRHDYPYQWTWLGLPILQFPSDILVTQEIIWEQQPDLIIETGVAWGGSVALYATLLQLLGDGKVIGIDLNLHPRIEEEVMRLPVGDRIRLIKGDSTSDEVVADVKKSIGRDTKVMVILDSNHTHEHVLDELRTYAPLVTPGQYMIVCDTIVEHLPPQEHRPRDWGPGNNPKTARDAFLGESEVFEEDLHLTNRLLETLNPGGYLRRVR